MNNLTHSSNFLHPVSAVALGVTAAIASEPTAWPQREPTNYTINKVDSTYSYTENWVDFLSFEESGTFANGIAQIYASLLDGQEPLGSDFEKIWDENTGYLYEE